MESGWELFNTLLMLLLTQYITSHTKIFIKFREFPWLNVLILFLEHFYINYSWISFIKKKKKRSNNTNYFSAFIFYNIKDNRYHPWHNLFSSSYKLSCKKLAIFTLFHLLMQFSIDLHKKLYEAGTYVIKMTSKLH